MKKGFTIGTVLLLFCFIGGVFWFSDWRYSLPTPVPENFKPVALNEKIEIGSLGQHAGGRPVFLHFFNPDCPCSRFNMPHFKSLVKNYGGQVNFVVIVMTDENNSVTAADVKDRFDLSVPVFLNNSLANTCGVYATPQAVILDTAMQLYYRGNYNRSRYCTSKETNYAEQALTGLLSNVPNRTFAANALTAYGCSLPTCNNPLQ